MKRIFPPRKRARAVAQERREEQPAIDTVAFAIAIWLSVLVGAQLIQRVPAAPQLAATGPSQPVTAASF
ncbi:MAG TPA: hypothetical protein VHS58_19090 [Acetobacteraceae bacterium]|jgi:hypothetical protein|nr:hypothetical protein [Acetobacteraceae bacterium]